MSRSGFAYIRWDQDGVNWACTDPALFEAVLAELAQMVPGCTVPKEVPKQTFVAPYMSTIGGLEPSHRGRGERGLYHREVAWWIMKQLCEQGWEPFGASGVTQYTAKCEGATFHSTDFGHFHLRLVARAD